MHDQIKILITIMGLVTALFGFAPYIIDILKRKTKPHSFTWFIWSFLAGVAFFGQQADEGGMGTWITAIISAMSLIIFLLSLKLGEKTLTKSDWITFIIALLAIPLWLLTKTPLYSIIVVTTIDMFGFYPTFRKSWDKPEEETLKAYALSGVMYALDIAALKNYSLITVLFPAASVLANAIFVLYIFWRRHVTRNQPN